MNASRTQVYQKEILRLKSLYEDRIHLLLGIEQDYCTGAPEYPYDYVIGSVHCLEPEGGVVMVDYSEAVLREAAKTYYGGDLFRLCKDYYRRMAEVVDVTRCDIVGHFDLVTKFNEGGRMFDEQDPRYLHAALEALDALLEKDVVFEINTGAMSRGYRKTPYPSPILLRRIAEKRGHVTITSDSHAKETLLHGFADAVHLARSSGLGCIWVMTRDGWKSRPL